jgi:hypothetical protein
LLDLTALGLLIVGVGLFAHGREVLLALGNRTYAVPTGTTWLSVAERYDAQTQWGLWIAAAGLAIGVLSAVKHLVRHRRPRGLGHAEPR